MEQLNDIKEKLDKVKDHVVKESEIRKYEVFICRWKILSDGLKNKKKTGPSPGRLIVRIKKLFFGEINALIIVLL